MSLTLMIKYFLQLFILRYFLFTIVMATIPITLQITTSTDEDNRTDSHTNLSTMDTEDELHTDTSTWTPADRKEITAHDRISWRIPTCFWQGSLHLNNYEKKNIPYEPAYA